MKNKWIIILLVFVGISLSSASQSTTSPLKISLLTCSPGDELYSIFGHTAIRIMDSTNQIDVIFNYGTFDFNDPNFTAKFIQGKLDYFVSYDDPANFFVNYDDEKRIVYEQQLRLPDSINQLIFNYLKTNIQPENKFYKYDFLYNNCTSKIRDIINQYYTLNFSKNVVPKEYTFRDAIHFYLNKTKSPWNKLGIDLLLGSRMDKQMTIKESNFLPENLMNTLNNTSNLVSNTKTYTPTKVLKFSTAFIHPNLFFGVFALGIGLISFKFNQYKWAKFLVSTYLLVNGLIGCLLLMMWFATNHQTCANNFNLLWTLPLNLVFCFVAFKEAKIIKIYWLLALIVQNLTFGLWFFLPQEMNLSFLPLTILNMVLYYNLYKCKNNKF